MAEARKKPPQLVVDAPLASLPPHFVRHGITGGPQSGRRTPRRQIFFPSSSRINTGSTRGYVDFVWGFIGQMAEPGKPAPIMWHVPAMSPLLDSIQDADYDDLEEADLPNEWRRSAKAIDDKRD